MPASVIKASSIPRATVSKKIQNKHDKTKEIVDKLTAEVDKKGNEIVAQPIAVQTRVSVNNQILYHSVKNNIKSLGSNPILLVQTNSVKKGISLKTDSAGVGKKTSKTRKDVSKALQNEILKYDYVKPSELVAKTKVAKSKELVNTEIVKKAVLSQLSKKPTIKISQSNLKSPAKASPKASPAKTSPVKTSPTKKPKALSATTASAKSKKRKESPTEGNAPTSKSPSLRSPRLARSAKSAKSYGE